MPFPEQQEPNRPTRIEYPDPPGMKRMRLFSHLLDQSILLPNGYRIGLDPIVGLVPGLGDLLTTSVSLYMVCEAYRLGVPIKTITKMLVNIGTEALVGAVPVLGDLFDAVWKANMRNLRLVEEVYHPTLKQRSLRQLVIFASVVSVLALGILGFILFLFFRWILSWF